ncbi:MAG TPA: hypothetical protein VNV25_25575 [Gemmatimonadaceae bacterium]|jgi:hypothetical protein|nr:hypothetical protein [Gemmatimonadaceae bacterium]
MNNTARYAVWMASLGVLGAGGGYLLRKDAKRNAIVGGAVGGLVSGLGLGVVLAYLTEPSPASKIAGSKSPPAGGCPAGTYWNGNACIHQVVFQGPQPPQQMTSLTLDAGNLSPPPIKTYSGIFNVYSPPVQGNTGGGWINSASSNPAIWTPLVNYQSSSLQVLLTDVAGTVSVVWYDAASGRTLTTNLRFVA